MRGDDVREGEGLIWWYLQYNLNNFYRAVQQQDTSRKVRIRCPVVFCARIRSLVKEELQNV